MVSFITHSVYAPGAHQSQGGMNSNQAIDDRDKNNHIFIYIIVHTYKYEYSYHHMPHMHYSIMQYEYVSMCSTLSLLMSMVNNARMRQRLIGVCRNSTNNIHLVCATIFHTVCSSRYSPKRCSYSLCTCSLHRYIHIHSI